MQRDLDALEQQFDAIVIGAGVYGACIARLASLHGLKIALIERGDFCGETSRNSAKLVHGGLRYVQHFDLPRIRESAAAHRAWRIAAPHLVRPLRFVIPAYGMGTRGPAALAAGMAFYELATWRRNRGVSPEMHLPRAGILSRKRLLSDFPMLERHGVTGGAFWFDSQMLDATRLAFECIAQACQLGAVAVNHVEATGLLVGERSMEGVAVRDRISGREMEVRARVTVNATGPWLQRMLSTGHIQVQMPLARNINLVTRRLFPGEDAIGAASHRASDAAIGRSRRLFFVSPWQDCSIIGTWHDAHDGDAELIVTHEEIEACLREVNEALPAAQLRIEDVRSVHVGLTPGTEDEERRAKRPHLIDHRETDGLEGLISVAGPKYTTAPTVAERVLKRLCRHLGRESLTQFAQPLPAAIPAGIEAQEPEVRWVSRIYGARAAELLSILPVTGLTPAEHVFRCRVLYGLRHEMLVKLGDAIFRATDHAERGLLGEEQLRWSADLLASALGWTSSRRSTEMEEVRIRLGLTCPTGMWNEILAGERA